MDYLSIKYLQYYMKWVLILCIRTHFFVDFFHLCRIMVIRDFMQKSSMDARGKERYYAGFRSF